MAAVPNFFDLANQQYDANNAAVDKTNQANRANQSGPMGSSTWSMGPNGQWTNVLDLNDPQQNLFNTTIAGQQGLSGTIAGGVNYGNLPAMPDSGFGASQQVIDAWNALQQPGLTKSADAARARAAAMGITLGSNANNDIERTIGTNEATSRNQGILQGTQEYQNVFNRGLAARQQAQGEADKSYAAAISGSGALGSIRDSMNPNKWQTDTPTSAAYLPKTIYGAAQDTFNAQRQNENTDTVNRNANINSGINAVGALGGIGGIGNLWGGAQNLWNNWGNSAPSGFSSWDAYNYGNSGGGDSLGAMGQLNGWW